MNSNRQTWPALALALATMACASTNSTTVDDTADPKLPPYDGPRARILIEEFQWGVAGEHGGSVEYEWEYEDGYGNTRQAKAAWSAKVSNGVTTGLEQSLKQSLVESGRFICTDRAAVGTLRDEVSLHEGGYIDDSTRIQKGHVKSPDVLVRATVLEWDDDAGGKGASVGGGWFRRVPLVGGVGVQQQTGRCVIQLEIMDAHTLDSIGFATCEGSSSSWSMTTNGYSWAGGIPLSGSLSQYDDKEMGKAIRLAIAHCVREIVEKVPSEHYLY